MTRLRLLDGVSWQGTPLPGERVAALLAALVDQPTGVPDRLLLDLVWPDDRPTHPAKALQVLVSRVRSATTPTLIERYDGGYRLGLGPESVDVLAQAGDLAEARRALAAGDASAAEAAAARVAAAEIEPAGSDGVLADLRGAAARRRTEGEAVRAAALARLGRHAEALPLLEAAHARRPDDATILLDLLRAEAATAGPAAALVRYESYRAELADRLGTDPSPELQRLQRELLEADDPVRTGLRYDVGGLLGREDDLARLRAALAAGRLTTVLGPGGIGKTSIAQVLARESTLPRVHVVELVGVADGDDVVAEVGAALGVRGSITSRGGLTAAQHADVRTRIAQELDSSPTLLVLDNCEHLLEPVASLVAFLLVSSRDLTVLATSRAPLRIAAERVVPLSQLAAADAADLFCRRARAVRPDAELEPGTVAAIVERLDGLPLAIELAAARVRSLSADDVRRRLDDRFELLRGRDRSAPARHRTLGAVIEWSWDLLSPAEQRALARLAVFHDGFDLAAAASMLGEDAGDPAEIVETLVDHSLLVVQESLGHARYRALETIREFGRLRLAEAGEEAEALAAQDRWAADLAGRHADVFAAPDQIERVDELQREENNLTDVLRRALSANDRAQVARLLATLGQLWIITGNHPRVFTVADAAEEALVGWDAPEELHRPAADAAAILLVHFSWMPQRDFGRLLATMRSWGARSAWADSVYVMFSGSSDDAPARLASAALETSDAATAGMMLLWGALMAENDGDPREARRLCLLGLELPRLTPFLEASLYAELEQVEMVLGDHRSAARYAERAWPLMLRLHAADDARSLRISTALAALVEGDVDRCERILDAVEAEVDRSQLGSRMAAQAARGEVALARGEAAEGLRLLDEGVDAMLESGPPGLGFSPWLILAATTALVARVHHADGERDPRADELARLVRDSAIDELTGSFQTPDLPLDGLSAMSIGAWALRFGGPDHLQDGLRLLALADRFAYNRSFPTLAWAPVAALADAAAPGRLDALREEYAGLPGTGLLTEAAETIRRITSSG